MDFKKILLLLLLLNKNFTVREFKENKNLINEIKYLEKKIRKENIDVFLSNNNYSRLTLSDKNNIVVILLKNGSIKTKKKTETNYLLESIKKLYNSEEIKDIFNEIVIRSLKEKNRILIKFC